MRVMHCKNLLSSSKTMKGQRDTRKGRKSKEIGRKRKKKGKLKGIGSRRKIKARNCIYICDT